MHSEKERAYLKLMFLAESVVYSGRPPEHDGTIVFLCYVATNTIASDLFDGAATFFLS